VNPAKTNRNCFESSVPSAISFEAALVGSRKWKIAPVFPDRSPYLRNQKGVDEPKNRVLLQHTLQTSKRLHSCQK